MPVRLVQCINTSVHGRPHWDSISILTCTLAQVDGGRVFYRIDPKVTISQTFAAIKPDETAGDIHDQVRLPGKSASPALTLLTWLWVI